MEISLELLGPASLRCGRHEVKLPPGKPRALLTLLLLAPNRILTTDRLMTELWDSRPPSSALANLRTYAAALRRLLSSAGGNPGRLLAGRSGCVLEIDPASVRLDLEEFERLSAAGSASLTRGESSIAATQLAQALVLWRGRALEDVPRGPVLTARATVLEEKRLSALEDLAAAQIDIGQYLAAISPLRQLLHDHPYRERAWALLMTALYGSGDVSAALDAYAEARTGLVDELGVEPGAELRQVHQAVLSRSLVLSASPAAPGPSVAPAPRQLPPDLADFSGRTGLLGEVTQFLGGEGGGNTPPVAVLSGVGGAGKTTVAVRAAHLLAPTFPDGQLFIDLGGSARPADAGQVLAGFLVALGVDPTRVPASEVERAALFRSTVADRRVLVVVDNATTAAQVRPLLPAAPGCGVLVTSRRRLAALPGARLFEVGLLTHEESTQMLTRIVGDDRVGADPAATARLSRYCGGLPLALRVIAGRLLSRPHWSTSRLAERLADERGRLDELVAEDLAVRASIAVSYRELTPERATALRTLAVLPVADPPAWAAAALLERPVPQAERLLESVADARLLDAVPSAPRGLVRYHMHELVRLFAGEEADRRAVVAGGGAAWLTLLERAAQRLPTGYALIGHGDVTRWAADPHVEQAVCADPLAWFDAERAALRQLVAAAAALDLDELAWDLAATAMPFYDLRWHPDDWRDTHEDALAAVRRAGNRRGEAHLLRGLGELAANMSDYGAAVRRLRSAAHRFAELGERRSQAHTLLGLGNVRRLSGHPDEALTCYAQAARLGRCLGDRQLDAELINNTCAVHLQQERLTEAVEGFAAARRTYQELSDYGGVARSLRGLARARQRLGDHDQAIAALRAACDAVATTGDRRAESLALVDLSRACLAAGRLTDTGAVLDRCFEQYRQIYHPFGYGSVLAVSAELSLARGDWKQATTFARQAVEMFHQAGILFEKAKSLRILSKAQGALGNAPEAHSASQAATAIFSRLSVPHADEAGVEAAAFAG